MKGIDLSKSYHWDRKRIDAAFPILFEEWKRRRAELMGSAALWSDAFLKTSALGRRLRKSLQHAKIAPEAYLWRLTGPIKTEWHRFRRQWDPDEAHEDLRAAHAAWKKDAEHGKLANRKFNVLYLVTRGWRRLYVAIVRHHQEGIHDFVHRDPAVAKDWIYNGPWTFSAVRTDLLALLERWHTDPLGLPIGRPFGKTYLLLIERAEIVYFLERHGVRRILQTPELAPVRAVWGKRVPGKYTHAWRAERRESFRKAARHVTR